MATLSEMALRVAPHITSVRTSAVGTVFSNSFEDMDLTDENAAWNGGTLWFRSGDSVGRFYVVEAYNNNVIYLRSDVPIELAEGDMYSIIDADYPLWLITEGVNNALGKVLAEDTTLTFISGQRTYTLPDNVRRLAQVEFESNMSGQTYRSPCHHWYVRGSKLHFDSGNATADGNTIVLLTEQRHEEVFAFDDLLQSGITDDGIMWTAVVFCLEWGYRRYAKDPDRKVEEYLQFALENKKSATFVNQYVPVKKIKTAGW